MSAGPICPRCGRVARSSQDVDEPVIHVESGRSLYWTRTLRRFEHEDRTCEIVVAPRIPIPPAPPRGARLVERVDDRGLTAMERAMFRDHGP